MPRPTAAARADAECWLPARAHGRALFADAAGTARGGILAFHGYGETADAMLARGGAWTAQGWHLCAAEGLHRFYRRGTRGAVGASWMTRHGRDHDLAANRALRCDLVEACRRRWGPGPLILAGFSQGAAQAWYGAQHLAATGVIAAGGALPPECRPSPPCLPALLLRGTDDRFYPGPAHTADRALLCAAGCRATQATLPGGHAWDATADRTILAWLATLAEPDPRDHQGGPPPTAQGL